MHHRQMHTAAALQRARTWVQDVAEVCARKEHRVIAPKVRLARNLHLRKEPLPAAAAATGAIRATAATMYRLYIEHYILHKSSAGQKCLEWGAPVDCCVHVCCA